jgi:hypothetical protein
VFRAEFLGFQMRYKVLELGTQYERRTPKFRSIVYFFFARVRSLSRALCESLESWVWEDDGRDDWFYVVVRKGNGGGRRRCEWLGS